MRKIITLGIMLLFLGMTISSSTGLYLNEQSIKPLSSGNILYVGGNGTGNYTMIQDAIDDSSDGDTVYVYDDSSPYYEYIQIDKSINLIGEDRNSTVLDGNFGENNIINITGDRVTINGFTIRYSWGKGIFIYYSNNNSISGNTIIANWDGIVLNYCNDNIIINNIISNMDDGIYLKNSNNNTVIKNNISHNDEGLNLLFSANNDITGNTITSNYKGMYLNGFHVEYNTITTNTISDNYYGIQFLYGKNNSITENAITSNHKIGLQFKGGTVNNNIIYHNIFKYNNQHVDNWGNNTWDNGYPSGGNYWDNYSGTDNYWGLNQNIPGSDGVGDIPYEFPCEYVTDRYPLMEPYGKTILSLINKPSMFGISLGIQNIGYKTAFNVNWKIVIEGGFVIGRNSSGITKPLLPGEKVTIKTGIILGLGKIFITIAVWADNAPYVSRTTPGFLFLFLIRINPGGGI